MSELLFAAILCAITYLQIFIISEGMFYWTFYCEKNLVTFFFDVLVDICAIIIYLPTFVISIRMFYYIVLWQSFGFFFETLADICAIIKYLAAFSLEISF